MYKRQTKYSDATLAYTKTGNRIGTNPGNTFFNDAGLNFFVRLILESRYDFVIEVGAHSLERSVKLKSLFPQLKVFGLDVTTDFAERRMIENVTLMPNTLESIRVIAKECGGKGLICSHGTLCYYSTDALRDFFGLAYELRFDLAIAEPNTVGEESLEWSLMRTYQSRYHPYLNFLRTIGFRLPDGQGRQIRDTVSKAGEARTFIFAQSPV